MALKAGYVGIKAQLMQSLRDKLLKLDGIIPAGASSDNPLATESDINDLWDANAKTGVHQWLPCNASSGSVAGVTYTRNADDSISVTTGEGTATADVTIWFTGNGWNYADGAKNLLLKGAKYKLVDGNGDATTTTWFVGLTIKKSDNTSVGISPNTGTDATGIYSSEFTAPNEDNISYACYIRIANGQAINKTIKPLVKLVEDTDTSFTPYAKTNKELTNAVTPISGTVTSDFTVNTLTRLYRVGKIVFASIMVEGVTLAAYTSGLLTIPEGFRPKAYTIIPSIVNDATPSRTAFDSYGNAQCSISITSGSVFINGTWETEDVLPAALTRSIEEPAATTKTTRSKKTKEE